MLIDNFLRLHGPSGNTYVSFRGIASAMSIDPDKYKEKKALLATIPPQQFAVCAPITNIIMAENIIQFSVRTAIRLHISSLLMIIPPYILCVFWYFGGPGYSSASMGFDKTYAHKDWWWYYSSIG